MRENFANFRHVSDEPRKECGGKVEIFPPKVFRLIKRGKRKGPLPQGNDYYESFALVFFSVSLSLHSGAPWAVINWPAGGSAVVKFHVARGCLFEIIYHVAR